MQKILGYMRKAIDEYNMIEDGDKIAVALSGGKDSTTMLMGLKNLQRFYPKHFDLIAISVNPGFESFDTELLQKNCDEIGVPLFIEKSDIKEIKNLVKSINNENANIIVFTGDLVLDNTNITNVINELSNIKADYKYAVLGDKDNDNIKSNLESIGFKVLDKNYDYILLICLNFLNISSRRADNQLNQIVA